VKARFVPAGTTMSRNVTGQTPKRSYRLFLNPAELKENYEVVRESDGEVFAVTELRIFTAIISKPSWSRKKCCG